MLEQLKQFIRSRLRARSQETLRKVITYQKRGALRTTERGPIVRGHVVVTTRRPGEEWKIHDIGCNLVVTQAEGLVADMAIGTASSFINYIELGDPSAPAQPPALADTTLQQTTSINKAVARTRVGNVAEFDVTFLTSEGNGNTYTEAGLFVGSLGSGTMFARKTFNGIAKTASFELRITWYITFLVNESTGVVSGVSLLGPASFAQRFTSAPAAGGENSVTPTFNFTVGSNQMIVFLNNALLKPVVEYTEVVPGSLTATTLGSTSNKGINLVGFSAAPGDVFHFYLIALA